MRPFAINLRHYRNICELSQQQLADILEIPMTRYQSYEEGRGCPKLEDYASIVQKLRIKDPMAFISDSQYFSRKAKDITSGFSSVELKYKKLSGSTKKAVDILLGMN